MSDQPRPTIGERISQRLQAREGRRVRVGPSPTFQARLSHVLTPGKGMAASGFTIVSGTPFYEMMARLARARQRRDARLQRYEARAARSPVRALRRLGDQKRSHLSWMHGPSAMADSDFVFPEPIQPEPEVQQEEPRRVSGWTGKVKTAARGRTWVTSRATLPTQTRVVTRSRTDDRAAPERSAAPQLGTQHQTTERPVDRLTRRAQVATTARQPLVRALQNSGRPVPTRLMQLAASVADRPIEEQVRVVQRAARQMGSTGRAARRIATQQAPDRQVSPLAVASGRMSPQRKQRRGLRAVMSRSPMMHALTPPPVAPQLEAERRQSAPTLSQRKADTVVRADRASRAAAQGSARARTSGGRPTPSRRQGRTRPRGSDAGADGPSGPLAEASFASAPTARLAARSILAAAAQTRPGSVLPQVTPDVVAAASVAPTEAIQPGLGRALLRMRSGDARSGSLLPRAIATSEETSANNAAAALADGREVTLRGQTRRTRSVYHAPEQHVIAPVAPSTDMDATASGTGATKAGMPRPAPASPWKSTAASPRPAQHAMARRRMGQTRPNSLLPRSVPSAHGTAASVMPSRAVIGAGQRALARRNSAEPLGRSTLPRLTRTVPTSALVGLPTNAGASPVTRSASVETGSPAHRDRQNTVSEDVTTASPAVFGSMNAAETSSVQPVSAPGAAPAQHARLRSEVGTPRAGSLLPRLRPVQSDILADGTPRFLTTPRLQRARRDGSASRRMQSAPGEAVTIAHADAAATDAGTAASPSARSPWGPSPQSSRVVGSQQASASQRAQAQAAVKQHMAPMVQAAQRAQRSPLVGYSAQQHGNGSSRRVASVDVAVPRMRTGPIAYARRAAPEQVLYIQLPAEAAAEPTAAEKASSKKTTSILDFSSKPSKPSMDVPAATSPRHHRIQRQAGPVDRPLQRVGMRADAPANPVQDSRFRTLDRPVLGMRATARPTLWTGPDGVVVQGNAAPDEGSEDAAASPRQSAWVTPSNAPAGMGATNALPAPWSRPVWSRGGHTRPSSQLRTPARGGIMQTAGGHFVSQRGLSMRGEGAARRAHTVQDFAFPEHAQGMPSEDMAEAATRRPPLPWTLEAVDTHSDNKALPGWAQRASGRPRVGGSEDFLRQLARADAVADVVRVIFERAGEAPPVLRQMSSPVLQVIEQIRSEAYQSTEPQQPTTTTVTATAAGGGPRQAMRRGGHKPRMQSVARNMTGLRTISSAPTSAGVGEDNISKLSRRLRDLIHLAEVKNRRDEARQGVRMAEDSASAREEGQASPHQPESGANSDQVDIDALAREVLSHVQNEMALHKERRIDGGDTGDFWW